MDFKEQAKNTVDAFVDNGLDCPAVVHKRMEKTIHIQLKEIHRDIRHAAAESVSDSTLVPVEIGCEIAKSQPRNNIENMAKTTVDAFVNEGGLDCSATMHRTMENILISVYESVVKASVLGCFTVAQRHEFTSDAHNEIMNLV